MTANSERLNQIGERVAGLEKGYEHLATKADIASLQVKINLILAVIGVAMTALVGVGIRELFFG